MPHVPTPAGLTERAPELRSPLARAVVPVLAGLVGIGAILGVTWLIAVFVSRGGAESTERLAPAVFEVGPVDRLAEVVSDDGPVLLPGLETTTGERTLVLDHDGEDSTHGWRVFWAYPADRDVSCAVEQEPGTSTFVDCDGRRVDVSELAPPAGVFLIVDDGRRLSIDMQGVFDTPAATGGS